MAVVPTGNILPPAAAFRIAGWLWGGFFVIWMLVGLRSKRTLRRQGALSRVTHVVPAFLSFCLMFVHPLPWPILERSWAAADSELPALGGLFLMLAGFGLAAWARVHLGGNWSGTVTLKQDHQLVCSGPYDRVRHPIYSGLLLALLGSALIQGELSGLLAVALLLLAFWIKSRYEESLMRQTFGSAYDDYCASTGALLPRLSHPARPTRDTGR